MRKTYKFRIQPSRNQEVVLFNWLNRLVRLYNACIEQRKIAYRSYNISVSCYEQQKQLTEINKGIPEYSEIYSQVAQETVRRVDKLYKNFFQRIKKGYKTGYPRFKSRNRYNSFTFPQNGFSIDGNRLKLSKIGDVKIIKSREIPPESQIKTLTIKRDKCGDWWATFVLDTKIEKLPKKSIEKAVGVDLGINKVAVLSDNKYFENKKHVENQKRKLKLLSRRMSRKKKGSKNREKARLKLARAYRKLQNQREDYVHKISRYLVDNYDLIAFEDLNIKNMMKKYSIAKLKNDVSWGKLIEFTTYKAEEAGKTVVLVDPYNTSQECSQCGEIVKKSLSVRMHRCPNCSFSADRDLNASFNILKRALNQIGQGLSEFTPVEIGVQQMEKITPLLSRSMKQEFLIM